MKGKDLEEMLRRNYFLRKKIFLESLK